MNKFQQDFDQLNEEFLALSLDQLEYSNTFEINPEIELFGAQQEKEELQNKIKIITKATAGKEVLLKAQINEISKETQALALKKELEIQKNKRIRESLLKELEPLQIELQKLEQEYSFITKSSKNKNKLQNASTQAKLKGYQESVKQLENRLEQISGEKKNLQKKNETMLKGIEEHKNMIAMTREELMARYIIRAEFIAENEMAEEELDVLKESALQSFTSNELQDYFEGCKTLNKDQEVVKAKIKDLENRMIKYKKDKVECEKNLIESEKDLQKFYSSFIGKAAEEEIENLEELIKETSANLGLEYIENVILSLNALEKFDIDEEILKIQLLKVEKEELNLREIWNQESLLIQETLKNVPDNAEIKENLEKELKSKSQKFFNKIAAINQWKSEVVSALSKNKSSFAPIKDQAIFLEFRSLSVSQVENMQSQKSFENILTIYMEKITAREKLIQENFKKLLKLQNKKENFEKNLSEINLNLNYLSQCKVSDQLSLSGLICKEKSLISFVKSTDASLVRQVENLAKLTNYWTEKIRVQTEILENSLRPAISIVSDKLKTMLKESQNCKLIIKDLTEEENNLISQLENLLQKQHNFMLSSLHESPEEPNVLEITKKIEAQAKIVETKNAEIQSLDLENSKDIIRIEQEESILNMRIESLQVALRNLADDQARLEECKQKLHKIEENEAAPIPNCMDDRSKLRAPQSQKLVHSTSPEKSSLEQDPLSSMHAHSFQKKSHPLKVYKLLQEEQNPFEKMLFEKISPLLSGSELYKRFSARYSLKQAEFDPLNYKSNPPEACGYGIRIFKLSKCLSKIDIKHQLRAGYDSCITIDSILKIIIPQITNSVLKVQKKIDKAEISEKKAPENSYELMKEAGYLDKNNKAFVERCMTCKWYPFSIALIEGGRIELIAKSYNLFRNWINGINCLIKNKKALGKLKSRINAIYL